MNTNNADFIIIGAGPAGLAAAQYGARANLDTLVFESMSAGGQALTINDLENYPGVFPAISGAEFAAIMRSQAESFGARFVDTAVVSVEKKNDKFVVKTADGEYTALTLLLATGAQHRKAGVPGEDELSGRGVSYCATCDGPFFKKKRIMVIGGGDAACDEAMYLANLTTQVTHIHRKDRFRAQAAVAKRVLENPNITVKFNTVPLKIVGENKVEGVLVKDVVTGAETLLGMDAVFIFVGMTPQTDLIPELQKDEAGYVIVNERMETSIPGLFAAGDICAKLFRQVVTATSDGAVAAHAAEKYISALQNRSYT